MVPDVVAVHRTVHDMPKQLENFLPKFDPDKKYSTKDHINKFMLVVKLMNVQHEDVICRPFPYTLENKASTWYFFFSSSFNHYMDSFETTFIEKLGEEKTPTTLVLDISRIKMDEREKVRDFNQRFLTLMTKIPQASKHVEDVSIDFYTSTLPVSMAIFVKRGEKNTLEATFKESIKVEKDMLSLKINLGVQSSKYKSNTKTKATFTKPHEEKKYQDSIDVEALQIIVRKLSNEIIHMKKNCGEGSTNPNKFFKFQPKKEKSTHPTTKTTPPSEGINMEDFVQALKSLENDTKIES